MNEETLWISYLSRERKKNTSKRGTNEEQEERIRKKKLKKRKAIERWIKSKAKCVCSSYHVKEKDNLTRKIMKRY